MSHIPFTLFCPVFSVALWPGVAAVVSVPEAAIVYCIMNQEAINQLLSLWDRYVAGMPTNR